MPTSSKLTATTKPALQAADRGGPDAAASPTHVEPRLTADQLRALYRAMRTARTTNAIEAELASGGDAFFHLPTTGHESVAAWSLFLTPDDWIHTHYRDQALWIARGVGPKAFFDSALGNADNYSHGRQMVGFQASRALNMPSSVVPVGNNCLQAVGIAAHLVENPPASGERPIVLCGMGDGTTQQGEVFEAIAEVVRRKLPVLFYIMDNGYAISTPTHGQTFFNRPDGPADSFYGLPIHRFNGIDLLPDLPRMGALVRHVRDTQGPGIAVVKADRLSSHTNADDHRVYRDHALIDRLRVESDPLANFRRGIIARGIDAAELDALDAQLEQEIRHTSELCRRVGDPVTTYTAKRDLPEHIQPQAPEYRGAAHAAAEAGSAAEAAGTAPGATGGGGQRLLMIEAMRAALRHRLDTDPRVVLLGEDIEDPKGDVFGVTRGLSTDFPGRVQNTALTESTIIGGAIGRAMAGARPVGFIQFADFLPNGISQIISELGSIYWRTGGEFECPVILMVTCGAYRPGLGPFHAHTYESLIAHIPGIDVIMPSNAGDAAGLLNAAFESQRPTVFFYPKACLNDRSQTTSADIDKHLVPLGKARRETRGDDLTLVAWGSTMALCRDAVAEIHRQTDRTVDFFDLRCIDPWDRAALADSARRTGRLLVVHEDNLTAGFGAEIVAAVTEDVTNFGDNPAKADGSHPSALRARRITRPDTYLPCNYANQLEALPSFRSILAGACDLLGLTVDFGSEADAAPDDDASAGLETIEAQGSSPADQLVTISQWKIKVGDTVKVGQIIADLEADKAVFEFSSPLDGTIAAILAEEGDQVDIGTPILKLRKADARRASDTATFDDPLAAPVVKRPTREDRGTPIITSPDQTPKAASGGSGGTSGGTSGGGGAGVAHTRVGGRRVRCYLSPVHYAEGSDRLTNADLIRRFPDVTSDDIIRRTGIESRPYCSEKENALSLAVDAARKALAAEGLALSDLTGIVCHTTTPPLNTPSMACMVLNALDPSAQLELMVYDVNAACSGWLYALDAAHNTIQHNPHSAVLVVTTECLSRVVDPDDFGTAILFGDAATATIMRGDVTPGNTPGTDTPGNHTPPLSESASEAAGRPPAPKGSMYLSQPVLAGKADPGHILTVGFEGRGHIGMDGKRVFTEAVRSMTKMTNLAFERSGAPLEDLNWLVPHQANERIFEAVRHRLHIPDEKIINLIRTHGNTSSSSIPLAIAKSAQKFRGGDIVGVCAFGGGFTFGAAILEIV